MKRIVPFLTVLLLTVALLQVGCDENTPDQTEKSVASDEESLNHSVSDEGTHDEDVDEDVVLDMDPSLALTPNTDSGSESDPDPLYPSGLGESVQPYEDAETWAWIAPIFDAGWCGPASLYHVMKYYGDQGSSYYYRIVSAFGYYIWGAGKIDVPDITIQNVISVGETAFALFIQPDESGSGWSLLDNVANLYHTRNIDDPIYDVFVCNSYTSSEQVGVRKKRLQEIHERMLTRNIPVVIHLRSGIPGFGHFVTLIGYEPDPGKVYYVDSLKNDEGIIETDVDDFLEGPFYTSGKFYRARWDGEWMAFWHHGEVVSCEPCYEPSTDE